MSNSQEKGNYVQTESSAIDALRRELRITRIFSAVTSILIVVMLAGGFVVCNEVKTYVDEVWPLVEQLSTVDFAAISSTMENLEQTVGTVDWEYMSKQLGALNVDAINEAIEGLDTEELTKALANINEAAETLQKLSDGMKAFASKFGF